MTYLPFREWLILLLLCFAFEQGMAFAFLPKTTTPQRFLLKQFLMPAKLPDGPPSDNGGKDVSKIVPKSILDTSDVANSSDDDHDEDPLIKQLREAEQLAKLEQDELLEKMNKAKAALAKVDRVRSELTSKALITSQPKRRPPNSRATIEVTDAGTLEIRCPSKGMTSESYFSAAFSLAWFSAIVPATFVAGPVLSKVALLPFWAAGGLVGNQAVVQPYLSSVVSIGKYAWSVENQLFGKTLKKYDGATRTLSGATTEVTVVVNDVPQQAVRLYGSSEKGMVSFGQNLSPEEQQYLADEINRHLEQLRPEEDDEEPSSLSRNFKLLLGDD